MHNSKMRSSFTIIICFTLAAFFLTGCQPLRKKFVRQKKKDKEEDIIPVLNPIDYEPSRVSPKERYEYHYSLWRVWYKEFHLEMTTDKRTSDKRQRYLLQEMITQIEEMRKWIVEEKQRELSVFLESLYKAQEDMQTTALTRNNRAVKRQVDRAEKGIRINFKPRLVEEFLIN
jgi:hypothetical protein